MLAMRFAPFRALTWLFSLHSHHWPLVQMRKPQHLSPSPIELLVTWGHVHCRFSLAFPSYTRAFLANHALWLTTQLCSGPESV